MIVTALPRIALPICSPTVGLTGSNPHSNRLSHLHERRSAKPPAES